MSHLVARLLDDFPGITFTLGKTYYWSPSDNTVYYSQSDDKIADLAILHETAHAILDHKNYKTDFELLMIEVDAWDKATSLAANYGVSVDDDHIQDCLDTYRDWLNARSRCPICDYNGIQTGIKAYFCFNCGNTWHVSQSRFCRPYRMMKRVVGAQSK